MADGISLKFADRIEYDFTTLPVGERVSVWLAENIDASGYRELAFAVRLHAATLSGTGTPPAAGIELVAVGPRIEDAAPAGGGFFRDASARAGARLFNTASPMVPVLELGRFAPPLLGRVSVRLDVTQFGATCAAHKFTLSAGVDLWP